MNIVIDCERLFDGQEVIEDVTVIIEGERIVAVHQKKELSTGNLGEGQRMGCRFAMPGLIDSHVHVGGYHEGFPGGAPFQPAVNFLRLLVYNGVTTVRDTGNSIETIKYLREWGEKYSGPRVFSSGPLLDLPPLTWPFSRIVRNPETARHEVELLHLEGMNFIKTYRNVTPEILKAIVEAADSCGMGVAAHVEKTSAREACELGVKSLEHVVNLFNDRDFPDLEGKTLAGATGCARLWSHVDPKSEAVTALLHLLRANQTYVCPTLLVSHRYCSLEAMVNDPYLDYMVAVMPYHKYFKRMRDPMGRAIGAKFMRNYMPLPSLSKSERAEVAAGLQNMRDVTSRLHDAGVNLVTGTDSPNPSVVPGFSLHQEMELMVRSGMPPLAVLRSATSAAGKVLGRDDLGVVKPGACADMVLLNADPAANILNTMHIQGVIKAGRLVDRKKVRRIFRKT